jgi:hypothetical protein
MDPTKTLNETAVQRVLDRAVQLDAGKAGYLDQAQVHSIAAELGLSPSAVQQALAEYEAERAGEVRPSPVKNTSGRNRLALGAIIAIVVLVLATTFIRAGARHSVDQPAADQTPRSGGPR